MRIINYQTQTNDTMSKNKNTSGYYCPYVREDCLYIDSLSMTKTIICNQCAHFVAGKRMDNSVNISVLSVRNSQILLTHILN